MAAALLAACQPQMPAPRVISVEPDRGWSGEDTLVTLHGSAFYPQVELDAGRRGGADLDRTFEAWLHSPERGAHFSLTGVAAESYERLRGIVPQGLPAGTYDLVVRGPTGQEGRLASAFTVADTRADRMVLESSQLAWQVQQYAQADLYLVDPHGERVFTDLPMILEVSRDSGGPVEATFGIGVLHGQEQLSSASISGTTGPDGFARVLFTVTEPDTYTLTATSQSLTSRLDPVQLRLLFEHGEDLSLAVQLPTPGFEAAAGEPFEVRLELHDQFGNPVPDIATTVPMRNLCGTWLDLVLVRGPTTVPVTLTTATTARCPQDALLTDEISAVEGLSDTFVVHPGEPQAFEVDVGPGPHWAGAPFLARITPRDGWGNMSPWSGDLQLSAAPGGPVQSACGPVGAAWMCTGTFTYADPQVILEVSEPGGDLSGAAPPVEVRPSDTLDSVQILTPDPLVAGEPAAVEIIARDPYGNIMDAGSLGAAGWALIDDLDDVICTFEGQAADGAASFECTAFIARGEASLQVEIGGQTWSAGPVEVVHGPLAQVGLDTPAWVEAGEPFGVEVWAADAWGNPYLDPANPILELSDLGGTLGPTEISLQSDGTALFDATLTGAGFTRIEASQGGVVLGESSEIGVQAGPTAQLTVSNAGPWVWVGLPDEVIVEAVDAWGNRTDLEIPVQLTLQSTGETYPAPLLDGRAALEWEAEEAGLDEVWTASSAEGFEGESAPFHVVHGCAGGGPTPALSFAGQPDALACADPLTGTGTVAGSFAGSASGDHPLFAWALARDEGPAVHASIPSALLELPGIGAYRVRGLVIDEQYCAAEIEAMAWVGPDDGRPVGPVHLLPGDDLLNAKADTTTVSVEDVRDCAGDIAAGGSLRFRTTLGELEDLEPTGEGLRLILDSTGGGAFTFSALDVESPGLATLHAWSEGGSAGGIAELEIIQDHQPPVVLAQFPSGYWPYPVESLRLVLSEPLRENTVIPANFSVSGPGPSAVSGVSLEEGGTEVVVSLDPPAQGADGSWTLMAADLRDLAGNRLDGDFSGSPTPWISHFGAVPTGPLDVSCALIQPVEGRFRPNGDPGLGVESETVQLSASRTGTGQWWVLTVRRGDSRVLRRHIPSGAAEEILSWDGRDQGGVILENGAYLVEIEIVDGYGNRSDPCEVEVWVDNAMGGGW